MEEILFFRFFLPWPAGGWVCLYCDIGLQYIFFLSGKELNNAPLFFFVSLSLLGTRGAVDHDGSIRVLYTIILSLGS
jgi:hypothetical protein